MPTIENYGSISNAVVEVDGVSRTLKEWAQYHQIPYKTVAMRYKRGHRDPKLLFFKPDYKRDESGGWVFIGGIKDA
jgi:hypothetical protein